MPDPTDPRAVAAQPALGYDTDCPECSGTGQRDSGGTHPWGEPAMMMCDCDAPPPAAPTDNTALVEAEKRGMQKVLSHFRECAEHDQGGLDYSSLVGIPICNADELASEVAFYERAARHVQDVLDRAALASREAPPDSDSGEKPLCPVCYNRTDAELRTIGGFYSMESNCPECSPRAKERAKQDADREALVRLLQIITRNGSLDDGRTLHEVIADALLARGLRPPACQQEAVAEKELLQSMLADAERDMRQRAADKCRQDYDAGNDLTGHQYADAILALPLKYADREGGV